jgi:hypothetical protein
VASKGKKKTTMAKLARESKLRERQQDKQARKDARRRGLVDQPAQSDEVSEGDGLESVGSDDAPPLLVPAAQDVDGS